jgi:glycosyltransferase involved in cell wall biosynthesis
MRKPTTALLIPCYNAEKYLDNLRKQVDALNPAFDEVLLVDDASTDGTMARARELGFAIHPLPNNRGPGGARNALLQMATTEWVHFLDADDELATDYLAQVLPHANEATDVVLSACDFLGAADRKFWVRWTYDNEKFRDNALAAAIATPVFLHCTFIRRSKALEAGGFDEVHRCFEDGDFHVRLAAAGARFACIPDVLSVSLRHSEGSGGNELYCAQCRLEFLKEYGKYLGRIPADVLTGALVNCGARLHQKGDVRASRGAFDLAFDLGWKGAESGKLLLRAANAIPSRALKRSLFLAQHEVRNKE